MLKELVKRLEHLGYYQEAKALCFRAGMNNVLKEVSK